MSRLSRRIYLFHVFYIKCGEHLMLGERGSGGGGISIKFRDESIWHSASPAPFCLAVASVRAGMSAVREGSCLLCGQWGRCRLGGRGGPPLSSAGAAPRFLTFFLKRERVLIKAPAGGSERHAGPRRWPFTLNASQQIRLKGLSCLETVRDCSSVSMWLTVRSPSALIGHHTWNDAHPLGLFHMSD